MPEITVKIADGFSRRTDGKKSYTGHAWISTPDRSYGFRPIKEGDLHGRGMVSDEDDALYPNPYYQKTFDLTRKEYNDFKEFAAHPEKHGFSKTYNVVSNNCVDYVWEALEHAHYGPGLQRDRWPSHNKDELEELPPMPSIPERKPRNRWEAFGKKLEHAGDLAKAQVLDWIKELWNCFDSQPDFSRAEQDASPIVIDLDGDGVKTLARAAGRHFDLDNSGFAEQTAWVDGADGLLVRDLDGNGQIESGAELFGNHTALADGTMAADGYAALAEHDDNGDGLIDAKDPIWRELQVWRDENSDAHSTEAELYPLADFDITAISLAAKRVSETDAAGNRISHRGTVTLADGSSRDAADVWFRVNTALSVYRGDGEVSADIAALPDVRAFGNVPRLHIAMQRDADLKQQV